MKTEYYSTPEELKALITLISPIKDQLITIDTYAPLKHNKKSRVSKKTYEEVLQPVFEKCCAMYRTGISYKNLKKELGLFSAEDQQKSEAEHLKLPWGEWLKESNIIIEHKGCYYLRAYEASDKSNSSYELQFENGDTLSYDQEIKLNEFLPPKKNKEKSEFPVINVKSIKFENITKIQFEDICFERK